MNAMLRWIATLLVFAIVAVIVVHGVLAHETVSRTGKRRVVLTIIVAIIFVLLVWLEGFDWIFWLW